MFLGINSKNIQQKPPPKIWSNNSNQKFKVPNQTWDLPRCDEVSPSKKAGTSKRPSTRTLWVTTYAFRGGKPRGGSQTSSRSGRRDQQSWREEDLIPIGPSPCFFFGTRKIFWDHEMLLVTFFFHAFLLLFWLGIGDGQLAVYYLFRSHGSKRKQLHQIQGGSKLG